jgi:hypothetical protein
VEETQQEMSALQQALISSEERRLQVGRALLDFRIEHNTALQGEEEQKYELRQKVIDLEGRVAQGLISSVCFRQSTGAWVAALRASFVALIVLLLLHFTSVLTFVLECAGGRCSAGSRKE